MSACESERIIRPTFPISRPVSALSSSASAEKAAGRVECEKCPETLADVCGRLRTTPLDDGVDRSRTVADHRGDPPATLAAERGCRGAGKPPSSGRPATGFGALACVFVRARASMLSPIRGEVKGGASLPIVRLLPNVSLSTANRCFQDSTERCHFVLGRYCHLTPPLPPIQVEGQIVFRQFR